MPYGEGVEKDDEKAVDWFRKAAEQDYADAQSSLAYKYAYGEGVEENQEKAVNWYRKAADQGDADAQVMLGRRYASGIGVEKDAITSLEYLMLAYKQGGSGAGLEMAMAHLDQKSTFYSPKNAYEILTRLSDN